MNIEHLARLLHNLIQVGVVEEVRHKPEPPKDYPAVRVRIGELLTEWIPWVELRAGESRSWNPPTKGEQGIVFSPSGDMTGAIFLAAFNSDEIPELRDEKELTSYEFPDKATVEYNHKTGAMTIKGIKSLLVEAEDLIDLRAARIDLNP